MDFDKIKALAKLKHVGLGAVTVTAYDTLEVANAEYVVLTAHEAEARFEIVGDFHVLRIR